MACKPALFFVASSIACGAILIGIAAGDAASAQETTTSPAADSPTPPPQERRDPAADTQPGAPFRPGAERLKQLQQQRLQQQQQGEGSRGMVGWPFDRPGKPAGNAPTEEEWQETVKLLSEISPTRWQLFEQVVAKPQRADRAKRFLFARYTELREMEQMNPYLYGTRVDQVKLEDELFKIDTQMRESNSPGEADQLREQLRVRTAEWVKKDLDERQLRLDQLQARLNKEMEALQRDRDRVDEIAGYRADMIRRSSDRFREWAGGRGKFPGEEPGGPPTRTPRVIPPATSPDGAAAPQE